MMTLRAVLAVDFAGGGGPGFSSIGRDTLFISGPGEVADGVSILGSSFFTSDKGGADGVVGLEAGGDLRAEGLGVVDGTDGGTTLSTSASDVTPSFTLIMPSSNIGRLPCRRANSSIWCVDGSVSNSSCISA